MSNMVIKLPHDIELLARQAAAQSNDDPKRWVVEILMEKIEKRVSKEAIRQARMKAFKRSRRMNVNKKSSGV